MLQLEILEDRLALDVGFGMGGIGGDVPAHALFYWNPGGTDKEWSTIANWHMNSNAGNVATALPTQADDVYFTSGKDCDLDVDATIHAFYYGNGSYLRTLTINNHALVVANNSDTSVFSVDIISGSIDFTGANSSFSLVAIATARWKDDALFGCGGSFNILNGTQLWVIKTTNTSMNQDGSIVATDTNFFFTHLVIGNNAGDTTLGATNTSSVIFKSAFRMDLDSTGDIDVHKYGELVFDQGNATVDIAASKANTNLTDVNINVITNNGYITTTTRSSNSITHESLPIDNYNKIIVASGLLEITDNQSNCYSIYQENITSAVTTLYTSGELVVDNGYYQDGGIFLVTVFGTGDGNALYGNSAYGGGIFTFNAGSVYVGAGVFQNNCIWDLLTSSVGTIVIGENATLYMNISESNTCDSTIVAQYMNLGGTLRVRETSQLTINQEINLFSSPNSYYGSFANCYYGWIGTTNLNNFNTSIWQNTNAGRWYYDLIKTANLN